jgi:hypothetical protein
MLLNDGTGSGNVAKVTADNRLAVDDTDGLQAAARTGNAFGVTTTSGLPTLTVTGTGGVLLLMMNSASSGKNIILEEVAVSTSANGILCTTNIGATLGTVADETANNPISLNSSRTGRVSAAHGGTYIWDEANHGVGGVTLPADGLVAHTILAIGRQVIDVAGGLIVAPGYGLAISFKGASECAAAVRFYEESL